MIHPTFVLAQVVLRKVRRCDIRVRSTRGDCWMCLNSEKVDNIRL